MNKWIKNLLFILIIISIYNLFEGCSINSNETKEIKIGITLYKQEDPFISFVAEAIEECAKEKEIKGNYKITVNIVDAKGNLTTQNNQVDKFISQDYDVICVNIVDRTAASTIINKAKDADIPLIFFNREPVEEDMQLWNKVYYVGADAEESGRLQGEIFVDEYKNNKSFIDKNGDGKIQYVMLEGEPEHQDSLIRTDCCIKTIVNNDIEVEKLADDTANWQNAQAYEKMTQWINEFGNNIEVVFSNNDDMALGAIHALENAYIDIKNRPIVIGIDGIPDALYQIKDGNMTGTVYNDYKSQGKAILDIAYSLAMFGNIDYLTNITNENYVKTSYKKITKENVDDYIKKLK